MVQVKELVDKWHTQNAWESECIGPYERNEGAEWAEFHREDLVLDFTEVKARYGILTYREIAQAWSMCDGLATTYEKFIESENHYARMIIEAVFTGELTAAQVSVGIDGVMEIIQNTPIALNDAERELDWARESGADIELAIRISRDDFLRFFKKQQPTDDSCLLNKWLEYGHPKPKIQSKGKTGEHANTRWLRETWISEGMPDATDFFVSLGKKYKHKKESPILDHWDISPLGPGMRLQNGKKGKVMSIKTLRNWVSEFKNE
jgi:hypothetical protein